MQTAYQEAVERVAERFWFNSRDNLRDTIDENFAESFDTLVQRQGWYIDHARNAIRDAVPCTFDEAYASRVKSLAALYAAAAKQPEWGPLILKPFGALKGRAIPVKRLDPKWLTLPVRSLQTAREHFRRNPGDLAEALLDRAYVEAVQEDCWERSDVPSGVSNDKFYQDVRLWLRARAAGEPSPTIIDPEPVRQTETSLVSFSGTSRQHNQLPPTPSLWEALRYELEHPASMQTTPNGTDNRFYNIVYLYDQFDDYNAGIELRGWADPLFPVDGTGLGQRSEQKVTVDGAGFFPTTLAASKHYGHSRSFFETFEQSMLATILTNDGKGAVIYSGTHRTTFRMFAASTWGLTEIDLFADSDRDPGVSKELVGKLLTATLQGAAKTLPEPKQSLSV